jgi:hypothetical protein
VIAKIKISVVNSPNFYTPVLFRFGSRSEYRKELCHRRAPVAPSPIAQNRRTKGNTGYVAARQKGNADPDCHKLHFASPGIHLNAYAALLIYTSKNYRNENGYPVNSRYPL